MNVFDAIRARRSIKSFTGDGVAADQVQRLLDAAVLAPNHRLTQPWRFLVLGPDSRRAYGRVLGSRKSAKVEDPAAAEAVARKVEGEYASVPVIVAVAMRLDEKPEVREEDFAATWMAVENLCLAAVEEGLGTHVKTGAVMDDPRVREALHLPPEERLVAIVQLGHPAAQPAARARASAADLTRWLP
jgi:nitroreductase